MRAARRLRDELLKGFNNAVLTFNNRSVYRSWREFLSIPDADSYEGISCWIAHLKTLVSRVISLIADSFP